MLAILDCYVQTLFFAGTQRHNTNLVVIETSHKATEEFQQKIMASNLSLLTALKECDTNVTTMSTIYWSVIKVYNTNKQDKILERDIICTLYKKGLIYINWFGGRLTTP